MTSAPRPFLSFFRHCFLAQHCAVFAGVLHLLVLTLVPIPSQTWISALGLVGTSLWCAVLSTKRGRLWQLLCSFCLHQCCQTPG